MADNKNQHYVPQSYFRLFSKNGTNIEAYNLKRKQSYTSSIRHMCSKDYFYSKDIKIEQVLSGLEDNQDRIMRGVVSSESIPTNPRDYFVLLSFLCMQYARTESAKLRANEGMDLLSDEIVEGILGKKADVMIIFSAMHLLKMKIALQSIPLLSDLMPVVMTNKTDNDFIFSDNPVVFHNTAINNREFGTLGLQFPGLQIFCPLGDKITLMFYDPRFYSVNIGENYSLEVSDKNDVKHINELQFLNCNTTIFHSDKSQEPDVKLIHDGITHLTGKRKMKKESITLLDDEKGRQRDLLHFYEEKPDYDLELSFVKVNKISNVGISRSPYMVDQNQKYMDEYDRAYESKLYGIFYKIRSMFKMLKFRFRHNIN